MFGLKAFGIIKCFLNINDEVYVLIEKLENDKDIKFPFCADSNVNDALRKFNSFFKIVKFTNHHEIISYKRIISKCILIFLDTETWITPSVELSSVD
jgi:hypothetical protein